MTRRVIWLVLSLTCVCALWWLRDPGWLANYRHGLYPDGWTAGRASWYVPSSERTTTFAIGGHGLFTTQVSVFVDGQLADRFSVGPDWHDVVIRHDDRRPSRRHRRLDVHVARAWGDPRRGVRIRF